MAMRGRPGMPVVHPRFSELGTDVEAVCSVRFLAAEDIAHIVPSISSAVISSLSTPQHDLLWPFESLRNEFRPGDRLTQMLSWYCCLELCVAMHLHNNFAEGARSAPAREFFSSSESKGLFEGFLRVAYPVIDTRTTVLLRLISSTDAARARPCTFVASGREKTRLARTKVLRFATGVLTRASMYVYQNIHNPGLPMSRPTGGS